METFGNSKQAAVMALAIFATVAWTSEKAHSEEMSPQALYEENCGVCHGYDGIPILPNSPNFSSGERMEKTDAKLLKSINAGKGDIMPPWQEVLTPEQQKAVLKYIRKLRQGEKQGG